MPGYQSPGVYVEEVPSAVKPIAGVGTSTAGFIGKIEHNEVTIPEPNPEYDPVRVELRRRERPESGEVGTPQERSSSRPRKATSTTSGGVPTASTGESTGTGDGSRQEEQAKWENRYIEEKKSPPLPPAGEVKLCTSFSEFKKHFGDWSTDQEQRILAHAVYGFFNNGGSRCYVVRATTEAEISSALEKFETIDEIAIVAAPGQTSPTVREALVSHCKTTGDRFAILDCDEEVNLQELSPASLNKKLPANSTSAAFYFPWIKVFDPATQIQNPDSDGLIFVPPSGHIAGIYARVDTERGVHKAPANEPVRGALGLKYIISKAQQDGLNPQGVNCIRELNGNIRVWGARTIGGDSNLEWKYISARRLFLYLRESIDEGMQWVVFEPNDRNLWAKITRNVGAFLTNVWRDGALFGSTPQEAFYVKCDDETNPPEVRDQGRVVTEVGVAIVKPAEFVVFRMSQWAGPQRS